jgi:hypothetical protein
LDEPSKRVGLDGKARRQPERPTVHVTVTERPFPIPRFSFTHIRASDDSANQPVNTSQTDQLPVGRTLEIFQPSRPEEPAERLAAPTTHAPPPPLSDAAIRACAVEMNLVRASLLETIKRLVKQLRTDELETFKRWFREFTGGALVEPTAKRGRGRPKGSTIASGAKPPTRRKTTDAGPAPAGDTVHG